MNLRERLDWAHRLTTRARDRSEEAREQLNELPWGEVVETPFGRCVRVVEEFSLDYSHGRVALRELLERQPRSLVALARPSTRSYAFADDLLFFDTETTGLTGGVGTVAFLVGIGYFRDSGFALEQYFARDFDEEPALLHLVRERLRERPVWVSYNGKTFDVPLLNQRLVLHRLERELKPEVHVDLLYVVRRFWKARLGQCSLENSEGVLLGVRRASDVPSYLVPELYFRYLRDRDPWPLRPVFDHNSQDILSLLGLLNLAARLLEQPELFRGEADVWQVGRLLKDRGRHGEAVRALERTLTSATGAYERKRTLADLGRLYKQLGRWREALQCWQEAIELPGFQVEPYVELAKYFEHRTSELERAEKLTRRALDGIRTLRILKPNEDLAAQEAELRHRLNRLLRKRKGSSGNPGSGGATGTGTKPI